MESILPYVILALGLTGTLFLFFSLKQELYAQARKQARQMSEFAASLKTAAEQEPLPEVHAAAPRPGFNLNKRVQAMRMLRRGEDATHIAAAMGVPDREIELLIRVQKIAAAASTPAPREGTAV